MAALAAAVLLFTAVAVAGAAAATPIPRVLHQIASPGESLDARVLAAELRAAHQEAGWQVHSWKQSDLLQTYSGDTVLSRLPVNQRDQYADFVRRRLSVLVLRDFGGVYVDRNKELVKGRTFDDILARLHPTTEFFTGMSHPGESARKVLDECSAHTLMSDKIKECGKYIPIDVGVMGTARGSRAIKDASGTWYHLTSPAEEIGGASDGQLVLFNWKFFSADAALADSVLVEREPSLARAVARMREATATMDGADEEASPLRCDEPIPHVVHQIWISNAKGMQPIPDHIQAMIKVRV
jgi:mannosyltransferase OCH1-like enzyme